MPFVLGLYSSLFLLCTCKKLYEVRVSVRICALRAVPALCRPAEQLSSSSQMTKFAVPLNMASEWTFLMRHMIESVFRFGWCLYCTCLRYLLAFVLCLPSIGIVCL